MEQITVRYAKREELEAVNRIRSQVNALHLAGRPDIFRSDGWQLIGPHINTIFDGENSGVIVAVIGDEVAGFASVEYVVRPASPYNRERSYYQIEEFGTDQAHRRKGVASAIIAFCRKDAKERGFSRIELDMWEFNEGALAFYEQAGFRTYRRYMEQYVEE